MKCFVIVAVIFTMAQHKLSHAHYKLNSKLENVPLVYILTYIYIYIYDCITNFRLPTVKNLGAMLPPNREIISRYTRMNSVRVQARKSNPINFQNNWNTCVHKRNCNCDFTIKLQKQQKKTSIDILS